MNREPLQPDTPETWEAVGRFLSGESTPEEAARVRAWLAADPARAELVDTIDTAIGRLPRQADVDVEAALRRVKARRVEGPKSFAWRTTLIRIAAAVLVVLGGSLIWRSAASRRSAAEVAAVQSYSTEPGRTESLRLADGTAVVLGPGSRLTVDDARRVTVSGEALFTVTHDPRRPFTVRASEATIQDVGTRFAVRSNPQEAVHVAVTEGSVLLHASGKPQQGAVLEAGDHGVVQTDGRVVVEKGQVSDADLAWTRGELVLEQASLSHVAAELRRWYGIELQLADATLTNRHVTASFKGESADQVLSVIALALGARIERNGNIAIVHSR